jgi:hypothetical protein
MTNSTRPSNSPFAVVALALFFLFVLSPAVVAQGNDGRAAAQNSVPANPEPAASPERQPDPLETVAGVIVFAILAIALVGAPSLMIAIAFVLGRWSARGEARAMIAASRCAPHWQQPVAQNPYEQLPVGPVAYEPHQPVVVSTLPDTARLQPLAPPPVRGQTLRFSSVAS